MLVMSHQMLSLNLSQKMKILAVNHSLNLMTMKRKRRKSQRKREERLGKSWRGRQAMQIGRKGMNQTVTMRDAEGR